MNVEDDIAYVFQKWENSATSLVHRFRYVGRHGLNKEQWKSRFDLVTGSRLLVSAINDDRSPAELGSAVRRAARSDIQARLICRDVQHATHTHPDGASTLEPLLTFVVRRARILHLQPEGVAMLLCSFWAASVGHGPSGARLPSLPEGVLADLTHVPTRIGEHEGERGEAQGSVLAGHEPGWGR